MALPLGTEILPSDPLVCTLIKTLASHGSHHGGSGIYFGYRTVREAIRGMIPKLLKLGALVSAGALVFIPVRPKATVSSNSSSTVRKLETLISCFTLVFHAEKATCTKSH